MQISYFIILTKWIKFLAGDMLTGIAVYDCTLHRRRNYGPQSLGTAGALIFWLQVSGMTTSADPEGDRGSRPPLLKITSYMGFYRE